MCASVNHGVITRKTYMGFLPEWVSVDRVRYTLSKLEALEVIKGEGTGKGTKYLVIKRRMTLICKFLIKLVIFPEKRIADLFGNGSKYLFSGVFSFNTLSPKRIPDKIKVNQNMWVVYG